jgi:dihydroneopterin aldolase
VHRLQKEVQQLEAVRVKVIKLCPPINGDVQNVAIIIEEGNWTS